MKLLILMISFFISFQSLASHSVPVERLSFNEPTLNVKKVTLRKSMQTNLIRLYMRMPSEMRMIAGYKEVKPVQTKVSWLDGLRNRLKPSNGQMRL